jgi:hypothetical protein
VVMALEAESQCGWGTDMARDSDCVHTRVCVCVCVCVCVYASCSVLIKSPVFIHSWGLHPDDLI